MATPLFTPNSGFYAKTVQVTVTSSNSPVGVFQEGTRVFYTLDGSTPTLASLEVTLVNGIGAITLTGPLDLKNLTVRAFIGTLGGPAVHGVDSGFDTPVIVTPSVSIC